LLFRHDGGRRIAPHLNGVEYVILRGVVVPLAHDFFGGWVVKRGEGLVGELAHQVLGAVDFKWVELMTVRGHCVAGIDLIALFICVYQINFYIIFLHNINLKEFCKQ
jgi:hypothetical protein